MVQLSEELYRSTRCQNITLPLYQDDCPSIIRKHTGARYVVTYKWKTPIVIISRRRNHETWRAQITDETNER